MFGSIVTLLIVRLYGVAWGTIASIIASSCTYFFWGHPFGIISFAGEILFVGLCLQRRQEQNLLLLDALYWLIVGIPIIVLVYPSALSLDATQLWLLMLKQPINGIFNALIADLLLLGLSLSSWLYLQRTRAMLSLRNITMMLLVAFVLIPCLTLMMLESWHNVQAGETLIQTNLHTLSVDTVTEVQRWYQQSIRAATELAQATLDGTASTLELQQSTAMLQRAVSQFWNLQVADATGHVLVVHPASQSQVELGSNVSSSMLFQHVKEKRRPLLLEAQLSSATAIPTVELGVPIQQQQTFKGVVFGSLDLSYLQQLFQVKSKQQVAQITLVDQHNHVLISTSSNQSSLQQYDPQQQGELRPVIGLHRSMRQWLPVGHNLPLVVRWKRSIFFEEIAIPDLPWKAIVGVPAEPYVLSVQSLSTNRLGILGMIVVLAILSAMLISYWITQPLLRLGQVTTNLPQRLSEQAHIVWPQSWVMEIDRLVANFQVMGDSLKQKFQEMQQMNHDLQGEIVRRQQASEALAASEAQLRSQAQQLQQTLTELQRTQLQLIQNAKMSSLGQLVAGIAHEINNPVNFIYGNLIPVHEYAQDLLEVLELYHQELPHPSANLQAAMADKDLDFLAEDLPKLLNSTKVGAERIREIVLALRNFSRLDEAELKQVDIHEGLDSTLMILQNRFRAKPGCPEIQVIKAYGALPTIECYAGQLNQVFMNLLSNAVDALEECRDPTRDTKIGMCDYSQFPVPTIHIRTYADGDWISICIRDNGSGISPDIYERIFDPFFTTKPVGQGTGMGLSICHSIIVERHHGQLHCFSEMGRGSEFVIELPKHQVH